MPSATAFQTNFSAGALSPRLYGRVDVGKYMNGAALVHNMVVQRFGGARKRGGSQYINEVKNSLKKVRLIPFIFSVTQAYVLEFGDEYIRIYTNGGIVESGGSPVEVTSPYGEDDLAKLQFAQSADVLYLVHPDYAPRQFNRTSATTFTLTTVDFEDGPYLEINTTSTTLTPSERGSLSPIMTSNTAPSGTAANSDGDADAYNAFDGDTAVATVITGLQGWVSYDLPGTDTAVVDAYWIGADDGTPIRTPSNWVVEGYDGSDWITLDSRTAETGWEGGEKRFFTFANKSAYQSYRLRWMYASGASSTSGVGELSFNRAASDQTPFDLTASSTTGINDDTGFQASDVGRTIRLLGSDGQWRWAEITSVTSTTVVKIRLHGYALPDTSPIVNWRLGAWSDETGWPGSIDFFNGRLCLARTAEQPQTVWMSVVDDFTNFAVSSPLQDDDAITVTIASGNLNEVKWIAEGTDLFVGTTAAIRTIGATTSTAAFSPTNLQQRRETNYGAGDVQPVRIGTTALYSGYYSKDIRELVYSFDVNGYVSQNLSILSEHITSSGLKELAYAQDPDSVLWGCDDDGAQLGMTYERDQEVVAFHTHTLGGTSVTVESLATIPGTGSDEVWQLVKRTVNGATKRYIERLSEGLSDTGDLDDATYLDCHLTYSGSSTTTLTGLDHLDGESVYVWSDVGKQGPYTVSSGSITVGSAVTTACVGYLYTAAIETLSPEAAARGGTAQTRLGKISEVFLRVDRSMDGKCGPADGTLETLDYTQSIDIDSDYGSGTGLYTGDVRVPIDMPWERGKRIRVEHGEPTPFHLLGLITEIRVSG